MGIPIVPPKVTKLPAPGPVGPGVVRPAGACYYHPSLPAAFVCNRCGRSICIDDAKQYIDLYFCPECYATNVKHSNPSHYNPGNPSNPGNPHHYGYPGPVGPFHSPYAGVSLFARTYVRPFWPFVLSIIAGVLVIVNAAALLAPAFFIAWGSVFFWMLGFGLGTIPFWFVIGAVAGLIIIAGAVFLILGYAILGSLIVFPLAILALIIGGGFVAGTVLGVLAALLAWVGR